MQLKDKFQKIIAFAAQKHKGQIRTNSGAEYITHCVTVAENAAQLAAGLATFTAKQIESIYCIGLFHDLEEDTNATALEIFSVLEETNEFTAGEILDIQKTISKLTRLSKEIGILDYLGEIKRDKLAKIVKLTDLEHNLSDLKAGNLRDKYELCRAFLLS